MLVRAGFAEWLREQTTRMFPRRESCRCPLATYLAATTGEEWVVFCSGYWPRGRPGEARPLPDWASVFVLRVDLVGPGAVHEPLISAKGAAEVLDAVP